MTAVTFGPAGADLIQAEESLIDDWLSLTVFLAEAVTNGNVPSDVAETELASAATGSIERQTLCDAAEVARAQFGNRSPITILLQCAACMTGDAVEAA